MPDIFDFINASPTHLQFYFPSLIPHFQDLKTTVGQKEMEKKSGSWKLRKELSGGFPCWKIIGQKPGA